MSLRNIFTRIFYGDSNEEKLAPNPGPLSPETLFKSLAPSMVIIETYEANGKQPISFGSGVVIAPKTIVTNKHVIERGSVFKVKFENNAWPCTLTHIDPDHDLCQLTVDRLPARPVTLRNLPDVAVGERVYAIGAPKGLDLTFSEGLVSGLRNQGGQSVIQTTAAISEGSSGGGLFDGDGRLIGITTSYIKRGQNLNFALPANLTSGLVNHPFNGNLPYIETRAANLTADISVIEPPSYLAQFIGQYQVALQLTIAIQAAKMRGSALDHILMHGPPDTGKKTCAHIIANEMGSKIHTIAGPSLTSPKSLVELVSDIKEHDVLFIDEIHRIHMPVEETLYSVMEDFKLDTMIKLRGGWSFQQHIDVKPFTLVGATTRLGDLSARLRSGFGHIFQFQPYEISELTKIILRAAECLEIEIAPEVSQIIAQRSRGSPRVANRLLKRCWDFVYANGRNDITAETATQALRLEGIDELGLTRTDYSYLEALIDNGGLAGLNTIAAKIGEASETVTDSIEPFLIREGLVSLTRSGRKASEKAYKIVGTSGHDKLFRF